MPEGFSYYIQMLLHYDFPFEHLKVYPPDILKCTKDIINTKANIRMQLCSEERSYLDYKMKEYEAKHLATLRAYWHLARHSSSDIIERNLFAAYGNGIRGEEIKRAFFESFEDI
jgi:hypothetical protein